MLEQQGKCTDRTFHIGILFVLREEENKGENENDFFFSKISTVFPCVKKFDFKTLFTARISLFVIFCLL